MRPQLNTQLDAQTFLSYYYLKEELVSFCKENGIPSTGNKEVLTKRIAYFLETGMVLQEKKKREKRNVITQITLETKIEENIVCSQIHRSFFKKEIGKTFSFNVPFQNWLKENAGKNYKEAIDAYHQIMEEKKSKKTEISKQFEYNTYIRDFFEDNPTLSLEDAIQCWNYKKNKQGSRAYEKEDVWQAYLVETESIDYNHPIISEKEKDIQKESENSIDYIKKAYEFVRDEISHSWDAQTKIVSHCASEVLMNKTGICWTKSCLLAALLRANGIPSGISYQLLTRADEDVSEGYIIHALNTVYVKEIEQWIRLDARGNKENVQAKFSLEKEQLAFPIRKELNEKDYHDNHPDLDKRLIQILKNSNNILEVTTDFDLEE